MLILTFKLILTLIFINLCTSVNVSDIIVLRQLVVDSHISHLRFNNFKYQMAQFQINHHIIYTRKDSRRLMSLNKDYLAMIEYLNSTQYMYGIISEDDTYFHPQFPTQLIETINAAGPFDILSLCNGNLWGRVKGAAEPFGTLVLDDEIMNNDTDPTGRIYKEWPRFRNRTVLGSNIIWPGSPVCLLILNRPHILNYIHKYIVNIISAPPDLIFRNMVLDMNISMKITAYPQLCIEWELGKV